VRQLPPVLNVNIIE